MFFFCLSIVLLGISIDFGYETKDLSTKKVGDSDPHL